MNKRHQRAGHGKYFGLKSNQPQQPVTYTHWCLHHACHHARLKLYSTLHQLGNAVVCYRLSNLYVGNGKNDPPPEDLLGEFGQPPARWQIVNFILQKIMHIRLHSGRSTSKSVVAPSIIQLIKAIFHRHLLSPFQPTRAEKTKHPSASTFFIGLTR